MIDLIHTVIFFILAILFVARAFQLPSSYRAVFGLHRATHLTGFTSSALLSFGFLGNAFDQRHTLAWVISDGILVVSTVAFLFLLFWDVNTALKNLRLAFKAIQAEFGADGNRMIALVTAALRRGR